MDAHLFLKAERERQRHSAGEVADYLGLTEDMVRRYDSGRSDISLRTATRYAEFLGKQLGDVLPASNVRLAEAEPIMKALQEFEPEEREEIVHHVLRTIAFMGRMMRMRAANEMSRSASNQQEPVDPNETAATTPEAK
ncbi:MAG TPA: helix-turn-helix transcriptional regulator [Gemmatimonadaceae bacterium]|nr:helix-turn-helix transcriptional regulator [Gemmatimonadaceae bacterium]